MATTFAPANYSNCSPDFERVLSRATGAPLYFSIFDGCGASNCIGYPDSVVASACNNEEPVEFSFDTFNDDFYFIHIRAEDEVHFTLTVIQSSASRFVANLAMVAMYTISVSLSNMIL
jgi:hypothetical protein